MTHRLKVTACVLKEKYSGINSRQPQPWKLIFVFAEMTTSEENEYMFSFGENYFKEVHSLLQVSSVETTKTAADRSDGVRGTGENSASCTNRRKRSRWLLQFSDLLSPGELHTPDLTVSLTVARNNKLHNMLKHKTTHHKLWPSQDVQVFMFTCST